MKIIAIAILLALASFFVFEIAMANTHSGGGGLENPLGDCNLPCLAGKITKFLFIISIPIVSIMVLVGGLQMMTAGGNPEKFLSGKKTILYAAIGFVVVLLADQVPKILQNLFK